MITLKCSDQDVANIMEGLSAMPLARSFDTFINVRQQVVQQRQPPQGPQATPPAPPEPPAENPEGKPNGAVPS